MTNITDQIIEKIKINRISATEVADCMNKTGGVDRVYALNRGHFKVGRVFWSYALGNSNWEHHEQIQNVPKGSILLTEPFECDDRAIFGDLVSKYLLLYKQVEAIVTMARLRDIPHLIKENWPIWLTGTSPIGCFNKKNDKDLDSEIIAQRKEQYTDAIAVCDDSGVVIIPKQLHTEDFLKKLDWIEEQEDIWFDCLDRRKWSTYDIVCLKKYREEQ